jgi:signal transduction histidine kinase
VETKDTQVSGLGIGLYLSKEIIDRHNGTFHVESEPGKGSVFSFEIPEQAPDQNIPE